MYVLARINKADEGSSIHLCQHLKAPMDLKSKYSYHTAGPQLESRIGGKKTIFNLIWSIFNMYFDVQGYITNFWAFCGLRLIFWKSFSAIHAPFGSLDSFIEGSCIRLAPMLEKDEYQSLHIIGFCIFKSYSEVQRIDNTLTVFNRRGLNWCILFIETINWNNLLRFTF